MPCGKRFVILGGGPPLMGLLQVCASGSECPACLRLEVGRLRGLLMVALPHVEASAGAEHMMDGFSPRKRPIDDAVEEIRRAVASIPAETKETNDVKD